MNTVLFSSSDRSTNNPDRLVMTDRRAAHIRSVLKLQNRDRIRIGEIGGLLGEAILVEQSGLGIELEIINLNRTPPAPLNVELILALPRPKSLRRCLRMIANIGIKNLHIIHSYRVEKSYWSSPLLSPQNVEAALHEGLEIAGDTAVPKVQFHSRFKPFAEDVAPFLIKKNGFVLHPTAPAPFAPMREPVGNETIAIGPEGGFIDYEVDLLQANGYQAVSLGGRVLSVEVALPTIVSRLSTFAH